MIRLAIAWNILNTLLLTIIAWAAIEYIVSRLQIRAACRKMQKGGMY